MGKRNNKKIKKLLKELIVIIFFTIILAILNKTGILYKINIVLENIGVIENTNISKSTESTTVKENIDIVTNISENLVIDKDKLNILFLDVGQADCELIINKGKTILIDSGNTKDGELIVNGIKALGISRLDYVIGTHVHEDHIGGMSYIVDSFDIGEFYLPYNTTTTSNYYKKLLTSLTSKNISIIEASIGDKIEVDDLVLNIMSVDNSEPEDANESSIVVEMIHGNLKYLFMGDATEKNENARQWNDVDLIKVGHHGSNTSSSEKFLNQVLPEIAIITVGEGNSYGLPKDNIIERYKSIGSKIYRTDTDGTLQVLSDGSSMEIVKIDISFDGNSTEN